MSKCKDLKSCNITIHLCTTSLCQIVSSRTENPYFASTQNTLDFMTSDRWLSLRTWNLARQEIQVVFTYTLCVERLKESLKCHFGPCTGIAVGTVLEKYRQIHVGNTISVFKFNTVSTLLQCVVRYWGIHTCVDLSMIFSEKRLLELTWS
jgi:hypothetical protein